MQLLPNFRQQYFDAGGLPLAGGKIYTYAAGTVTPLATYTDGTGGTPNANPIILDANGLANIWIGTASYKFVVKDSGGSTLQTIDNIVWIPADSVSTTKIVDKAVTAAKIDDLAVTTAKLNDASVTTNKIVDAAVTAIKIADGVLTNAKTVNFGFVPPGAILPYGGSTAPSGFLLCDGTSYLRSTYPDLSTALESASTASNFGAADATHFNVPDLRGRFIRGWDHGQGRDPDAASRTAMNTGGNTGDKVGTLQADQFASHQHDISLGDATANGNRSQGTNQGQSSTTSSVAQGGNETRPKNVNVQFIIKY